jgi:hypothetical protein
MRSRWRQIPAGVWLAAGVAGCAQPGAGAAHLGLGQVAGLGVGTAAGAVIGDRLGGNTGALIGGAAGLAGAAWLTNGPPDSAVQAAADAARLDERQKIMREYWYEQTESPLGETAAASAAGPPLHYPAGTYAGINFGARLAPDSSLEEPVR